MSVTYSILEEESSEDFEQRQFAVIPININNLQPVRSQFVEEEIPWKTVLRRITRQLKRWLSKLNWPSKVLILLGLLPLLFAIGSMALSSTISTRRSQSARSQESTASQEPLNSPFSPRMEHEF